MSLIEMVNIAKSDPQDIVDLGEACTSMNVQQLRDEVQKFVSLDDLAQLLVEDPKRAKSELLAACRQVFISNSRQRLSSEEQNELSKSLLDVVFGMGPIESLIEDENVTEIMINGSQEIYVEKSGIIQKTDLKFSDDDQVRVLIDKILSPLGRRIDESSPMVNARLPQGHRVNAVIPPLSPDGPAVTIRAFTRNVMPLSDMLQRGSLEEDVVRFLKEAVKLRKNIVVSGGTGSGKTTMLNALSCEIPCTERVVTIEDSLELKFARDVHVVRLEARPQNSEGTGEVTIRDLVKNALRMRPDRIIVGECRGGEALDMLQAMNTGHDGSLTTLHANSTADVIERMTALVRYAVDLPVDSIMSQLGSAFDYIIQVKRDSCGKRYLSEIASVDFDREKRKIKIEQVYSRNNFAERGVWDKEGELSLPWAA